MSCYPGRTSNETGVRGTVITPAPTRRRIVYPALLGLVLITAACTGESTSGAGQVRINSAFGGSSAGTGQGGSIAVTIQQRSTVD